MKKNQKFAPANDSARNVERARRWVPLTAELWTRDADRILAFDEVTGVLRAEAGYSLYSLYRGFLTRGWFTPVTPGTQSAAVAREVARHEV